MKHSNRSKRRRAALPRSRARWDIWAVGVVGVLAWGPARSLAAALDLGENLPVAAVDQATYDFGEVYEGEHISHTFTIRNTGSAPLEISDPAAKAENGKGVGGGLVAADIRAEAAALLAVPAGGQVSSAANFKAHGAVTRSAATLVSPASRPAPS